MSFLYYSLGSSSFGYVDSEFGFVSLYSYSQPHRYLSGSFGMSIQFGFCDGIDSGSLCYYSIPFRDYFNANLYVVSSYNVYDDSLLTTTSDGFYYVPVGRSDLLIPYSDYYLSLRCDILVYDYKNDKFYFGYTSGIDTVYIYDGFSIIPYVCSLASIYPDLYLNLFPDDPFVVFPLNSEPRITFTYKYKSVDIFDIHYCRFDHLTGYYLHSDDFSLFEPYFPFAFHLHYWPYGVLFGAIRTYSFPVFNVNGSPFIGYSSPDNYYISYATILFKKYSDFISLLGDYFRSSVCYPCCPSSFPILDNIISILGGSNG